MDTHTGADSAPQEQPPVDDGRRYVLSVPREIGGVSGVLDKLCPDASHHLTTVYGSADLSSRVAEANELGVCVSWREIDTTAEDGW